MTAATTLTIDALQARVRRIFVRCGVIDETATSIARVITAGERDQCKSHGVYRIEGCLRVLKAGKVAPDAVPDLQAGDGPVVRISAGGGYAPAAYAAARTTHWSWRPA